MNTEPVVLDGVIIGSGQKVDCKLTATKFTLVPSVPPIYSNYRVLDSDATKQLPEEADYVIEIPETGESIRARKKTW